MSMDVRKICTIGAGYVGGPSSAVIALKCPHIEVTVVDTCADRIDRWQSNELPIYEPGLDDVIKETRGRNLFFSTNIEKSISEADLIFICVNTPTKSFGLGKDRATDMTYIDSAARVIATHSHSEKIVVEKSTVPVRTAENIRSILSSSCQHGITFQVLSNPEMLSESTAIQDLINPNYVLIGGENSTLGKQAMNSLSVVYENWIPKERIVMMNSKSSELAKIACNAFGAQRVSSINSLSAICEATGADLEDVRGAIGRSPVIGNRHLHPSLGFGGSCFKKDISNLVYLSETLNLPEVAAYWNQVLILNEFQRRRFTNSIITCLMNALVGKQIAIFGFAYKQNTGDTRESSAIFVAKELMAEGALLTVYDPRVNPADIIHELSQTAEDNRYKVTQQLTICNDAYEAAKGSHAIVICTEWNEFIDLDYHIIYQNMKRPAWMFDGRVILDHEALIKIGFHVKTIGKNFQSTHCN